jgi:carboxypeptidase C (cathepsin A)
LRSVVSAAAALLLLCAAGCLSALAQRGPVGAQVERVPVAAPAALPQAKETAHTIELPGRALRFKARTGGLAIGSVDQTILADVSYVAYTLDGAEPESRPLVFAFNGGPGSASTWLHLGSLGPWRVPLTADTIASGATPTLIANAETWLDFADLVFIDPPGTGFSAVWPAGQQPSASDTAYRDPVLPATRRDRQGREHMTVRATGGRREGGPGWFWSVEGDIATFVEFVAAWVQRHGRSRSPIVLVGESYGGFRAPLIAEDLASRHGLPISALILVSPVLDFDGRRGWRTPQHFAALLPSIAATIRERSGAEISRVELAAVEAYARGDYVVTLMQGPRDPLAITRMSERVAALAGLPQEGVSQYAGRLTVRAMLDIAPQLEGRVVSLYDAGMAGLPPVRGPRRGGFRDPFTAGLDPPLTSAMDVLHERLAWRPARPYAMMSAQVNRSWRWPNSPHAPEALSTLLELHSTQPRLRTLVVHGFTDLVTPYFASVMQLSQLPLADIEQKVSVEVYPGGHMFYSRDASRARFRADAERTIAAATFRLKDKPVADQRETP